MRRELLLRATLALVAALVWHGAASAVTPAMVTEVQGEGELLLQGRRGPLQVRALMHPNDALQLAEGARAAVAVLSRGQVYYAYGPGTFRLRDDMLAAERQTRGRVEHRELAAAIRALGIQPDRNAQATIVTRSGELYGFTAIAPRGRHLEADARRLRWRAADRQAGIDWQYRVVLSDDDGRIVHEANTAATELVLPDSVTLVRGRPYIFEVVASGPLGRRLDTSGEFVLVDADVETRLLQARVAAGDDPTARTLLAIAYEEHGLAQSAAHAWQSLGASAQGRFAAAPPVSKGPTPR